MLQYSMPVLEFATLDYTGSCTCDLLKTIPESVVLGLEHSGIADDSDSQLRILSHLYFSLRRQVYTPNRSRPLLPLHCAFPGALLSPTPALPLVAATLACALSALVPALYRSYKGPSGPLESQVPPGTFTLLGPDSLYQTSL